MGRRRNSLRKAAKFTVRTASQIGTIAKVANTVSTTGSTAAGITSGLTTIGGGSIVGIAATALAPLAAVGVVGLAICKLFAD